MQYSTYTQHGYVHDIHCVEPTREAVDEIVVFLAKRFAEVGETHHILLHGVFAPLYLHRQMLSLYRQSPPQARLRYAFLTSSPSLMRLLGALVAHLNTMNEDVFGIFYEYQHEMAAAWLLSGAPPPRHPYENEEWWQAYQLGKTLNYGSDEEVGEKTIRL